MEENIGFIATFHSFQIQSKCLNLPYEADSLPFLTSILNFTIIKSIQNLNQLWQQSNKSWIGIGEVKIKGINEEITQWIYSITYSCNYHSPNLSMKPEYRMINFEQKERGGERREKNINRGKNESWRKKERV